MSIVEPQARSQVRRLAVIAYHSSPMQEPGCGDAGGMTVYVRALAASLARLGVHTDIFTRAASDDDRPTFLGDGIRVVPLEAGPRAAIAKEELPRYIGEFVNSARAFAAMQRIAYDLIHTHYWQSGIAGVQLSRYWDAPLVHSNHTLARVKNQTLAPGDSPEPEHRIEGEELVVAESQVLVASTEAEYHQLACLYGAAHDKLKVVAPGVDHVLFSPQSRAAARRDLGWDTDPVALFVGRIQPLKGVDLAVRSLPLMEGAAARTRLVLVGGASGAGGAAEVERLQALAAGLGVAERVTFLGPQPQTRLPRLYAAADLVLVCSHSESFGLAALEAHASGRAVVGTPVGGLSHIVRDGASGFLVDERDPRIFAERIATLVTDDELQARFEATASLMAREFTWDRTAESFLDLYECLLNESFPELCTC